MKKLIIAGGLAALLGLLLLLAVSGVAAQLRGPTFDPVVYERQQQAIEQARALAPLDVALAAAWKLIPLLALLGGLCYLGALGVAHVTRFRYERTPNRAGLLPVPTHRLDDMGPAALGAYHGARQLEAQRQPVPTNYSPHITTTYHRAGADGPALALATEPTAELAAALPGLTDMAALGFTPTKEAILLGLAEGGERITVPMKSLWHIGTAGPTGAGKSNIARLIIPQLQAIGAKVAIIDPKWTPYDAESDEDWRPIAARLFLPAARKAGDIRDTIAYFHDELDRRLELRNAGQRVGGALFLYADEYTTITEDVKDAGERIARLARLGRGVGIFLLVAAHDLLVKSGAGDTRDQLRTGFYLGGDAKTGAVLLDLAQKTVSEREHELGLGLALLRSAATSPARLVRVPYASNAAVRGLLADGGGEPSGYHQATNGQVITPPAEVWRKPDGSHMVASDDQATTASGRGGALPAEAQRAAALFLGGSDLAAIVFALRGIKSGEGRRYQTALAEVQALLRAALGQAERGA